MMRKLAWLPAFVLLVVGGAMPGDVQAQTGWTRYSYPDALFSANMPAAPVVSTAEGAAAPTTTYVVEGANETVILATNFGVEFPDVPAVFNAAEASRKADGGTVLSRRDLTVQGASAMDIVFKTSTGTVIADRIIYRKGWLYQLMITPNADNSLPAWGQQFFDSFRFID